MEKGSGYHLVNGERLRIGPGDLIMIRPQDAHTYAASTKGGGNHADQHCVSRRDAASFPRTLFPRQRPVFLVDRGNALPDTASGRNPAPAFGTRRGDDEPLPEQYRTRQPAAVHLPADHAA
ncbi:AraC family ligand binding domain-containing protein [uncultured Alistipes sp.]|uniref:AraC family ligand binding domain-containing protein n=1 Tax=uncultured Alistipes sp. TaxID=538949 RepID=UPI0025F8C6FC|nr:AraC family ligand binding domain-containing protein [uncultured Alistipes sp.]